MVYTYAVEIRTSIRDQSFCQVIDILIENNLGERIPPCRTPLQIVKYCERAFPHFMQTFCI